MSILTAVQLFDRVKEHLDLRSDFALSKTLNITAGLISKHRARRFGMDNATALKIAAVLPIDPGLLLLYACAERAKLPEERDAFVRLAIAYKKDLAAGKVPEIVDKIP